MAAGPALRTLSWTCVAALALLATGASAQVVGLPPGVTMPPNVRVPAGSIVLNPYTTKTMIVKPLSSQERRPGFAHTNILLAIPPGGYPQVVPNTVGPPFTGYLAETPASLACIYQLGVGGPDAGKGCNPNTVTAVVTGGSRAIAIVDAYDYPTAAADLATFNTQFGLASGSFTVIYGTGSPSNGCTNGAQPPSDQGGWNVEAALDIEMAHAMAPAAKLFLVEANSNSFADLLNANQVAAKCVQANGGGFVSNSWGGGEFSGESSSDSVFTGANVVYLASAGDGPGTEYPCVSPNVLCIGGTSIARNGSNGFFLSESVWNSDYSSVGTGGGLATNESRPSYQNFMSSIVGSSRGVPDLAAIADPVTGVWIYNSNEVGGWEYIGGTSVASPLMAGILNFAGFSWSSSNAAVSNIYALGQGGSLGPYLTNITSGVCGDAGQAGVYPGAGNPQNDPQNIQAVSGIHWSTCVGWGSVKDSGNPNFLRAMRSVQ